VTRRKLAIALAFLGEPQVLALQLFHSNKPLFTVFSMMIQILVLDEPTAGLDPVSKRHIWQLLDRAKMHKTILLSTHSMEEAEVIGDRYVQHYPSLGFLAVF